MPRQTNLIRRGSTYYVNVKVPKDLRPVLKKELIRKSLKTSDRSEAVRLVRLEALKVYAEFENLRRKLRGGGTPPKQLSKISTQAAYDLIFRYFKRQEKMSEEWAQNEAPRLDETELEEALDNLRTDEVVYTGGSRHYEGEDGSCSLNAFLREHRIACPTDSQAYTTLRPLFLRARLENTRRTINRIEGGTVSVHDPLFRDVFAHSVLPTNGAAVGAVTVGELLHRFEKAQKDVSRATVTQTTYKIPARIMREILGEETPLSDIGEAEIEKLCDVLTKLPKNAKQRYPGMTLQQAVAEADRRGDTQRLAPGALENYFSNIVTILNFAVQKRFISHNPANDRWLRERFKHKPTAPKAQFTIDELNSLFRAPLYTGCKNDESGYAIPGPNKLRRGRFWVPLLSLFHGLRLNEAAQLYTEDVKTFEGIHYLAIRAEREDGSKCEKRLKTSQSKRDVPLHPEILRIGFLEFVETRRKDRSSPRLFPELTIGCTGYVSGPFSKWFTDFAEKALQHPTDATFHSFRHQFRDATRAARLSVESVARLAGWEQGDPNQRRQVFDYGGGIELLRMLAEDIAKVNYPGVDLSHLYEH
jgi:hypothetical protein